MSRFQSVLIQPGEKKKREKNHSMATNMHLHHRRTKSTCMIRRNYAQSQIQVIVPAQLLQALRSVL